MKEILVVALALMAFVTGLSVWPVGNFVSDTVLAHAPAVSDGRTQVRHGHAAGPDPRVKYYRGVFDACRLFAQGVGDDELTATFNCLGFVKQLSDASYYEASER